MKEQNINTLSQNVIQLATNINVISQIVEKCLKHIPQRDNPQISFSDIYALKNQAAMTFSELDSKSFEKGKIVNPDYETANVKAVQQFINDTNLQIQDKILPSLMALNNSMSGITENVRELHSTRKRLANEVDSLQDEVSQSNGKINALQKLVNQLNKQLEKTSVNVSEVDTYLPKDGIDSHIKVLERQIEFLEEKVRQHNIAEADYLKEIEILNEVYAKLNSSHQTIKDRYKKQQQRIRKLLLEKKYARKSAEKQSIPKKTFNNWRFSRLKKQKSKRLSVTPSQLRYDLDIHAIESKKPIFTSQKTQDESLQRIKSENYLEKLQALKFENKELRSTINRLSENISDLSSTQESILQFTADIKIKARLIAKLRVDVSNLELSIAAKNVQINDLYDNLSNKKNEIETLQITIHKLMGRKNISGHYERTKLFALVNILQNTTINSKPYMILSSQSESIPLHYISSGNDNVLDILVKGMERYFDNLESNTLNNQNSFSEPKKYENVYEIEVNKKRQDFIHNLCNLQAKSSELIRQLENHITCLENNVDVPSKPMPQPSKINVLEGDQIINLRVMGSTASIRVPKNVFNKNKEAIILHLTFPSHNIRLSPDTANMKIQLDSNDTRKTHFDLSKLPD